MSESATGIDYKANNGDTASYDTLTLSVMSPEGVEKMSSNDTKQRNETEERTQPVQQSKSEKVNEEKSEQVVIINLNEIPPQENKSFAQLGSHDQENRGINVLTVLGRIPPLHTIRTLCKKNDCQICGKRFLWIFVLILYFLYVCAVIITPSKLEDSDYWCDGDGFLLTISAFAAILLIYFKLLKPMLKERAGKKMKIYHEKIKSFSSRRKVRILTYSVVIGAYVIFLLIDTADDYSRLISAVGAVVFLALGALFSISPTKIKLDQIVWGIGLQFIFGLLILRWSVGRSLFQCLGAKVTTFLDFTNAGTLFTFGDFLNTTNSYAFKILPVVLYFGVLISVLYHYGIIQWIIIKLGWVLGVSMGTTPCESMAAVANIFLGQSEAPLVIRPYLTVLTKSELHAVMSGGFATVAGGILAAYISFGANAAHLLSASIMSAPASLAISKVLYPEVEKSVTNVQTIKLMADKKKNVLHAIMSDLTANLPIVANITAVLIVVISTTTFVNAALDWFCQLLSYNEGTCEVEGFLGFVFWPVAWLMGVPSQECYIVGRLIGIKMFISEFIAFQELNNKIKKGLVSARTVVISTYTLCGFSSIASMGCVIGSLSSMAPSRMTDIVDVIGRAFVAGNVACFLTACVAGTLIKDSPYALAALNDTSIIPS